MENTIRFVFDQGRHDEHERLAAMERLWDPGTDISTLHLDGLAAPNLEVRRHDILSDPLPSAHFDLVHARLVMEHLGRRSLERAVAAVRPGGWLVLESMAASLIASDELTYEDLSWALATPDDPDSVFLTPMIAAWGRRPERGGGDRAPGRP